MRSIDFPKHQERKRNVLDNFVFSTRVRVARNLEGIKFPHMLSEKEKSDINEQLIKYISNLPVDITLESLDEMPREKVLIYQSNHIITNEFIRNGRVLAYDISGNWVMLLNEDDHIRIFSIEEGYNIKSMYNRISSILIQLENEIDFAFDEKFGYLTASAMNFGTGLRLSALVNLYGLAGEKNIENFIDTANKTGYSVTNIAASSNDSPLFYVCNIFSLGISEEELVSEFDNFLQRTMEVEMDCRKAFFIKQDELDLSLEEILEINKKDSLDWNNLVYYISLIDALNKKHITADNINRTRNLIFQCTDEYLQYKLMIEPNDIPGVRINMLKNCISNLKYKNRSIS
jgi:protein arginine kinase